MDEELLKKTERIIELNKNKKSILSEMANLEINGNTNSEEYNNFVSLYMRINKDVFNIISQLSDKEKLIIHRVICRFNPTLYESVAFQKTILDFDNPLLVYKKTLIDLGNNWLNLYKPDMQDVMKKQVSSVLNMFGISIELEEIENEERIDVDAVNYYMASDFTNVLYSEIEKYLFSKELSPEERKELINIKYTLIYYAPNIEKRAIETVFLIPDTPRLTSIDDVIDTGINYKEYLNKLDIVMIDLLEISLNNYLHMSNIKNSSLKLSTLMFLKAEAAVLDDYEVIDCIDFNVCNANSMEYLKLVDEMRNSLEEAKADAKNNHKLRKYTRI